MSNKRIDMTQFEGHTEGPWLHCKSPVNGGEQFWSVVDHTQDTDIGDDTLGNWRIADIVDYEVDAKLLAAGPTLLAELKRCYEREDLVDEVLLENAEMMREYIGQFIDLKRKIRDVIDACEGVDSLFGEEVVGMLREVLA